MMVLLPQAQFAMICMYFTSALWGCWVIITGSRYNLEMEIIRLDFKTGIEALLREKPIKAIFLGTRIGDPNAVHILTNPSLQGFCERVLKLIASIINCQQVWMLHWIWCYSSIVPVLLLPFWVNFGLWIDYIGWPGGVCTKLSRLAPLHACESYTELVIQVISTYHAQLLG